MGSYVDDLQKQLSRTIQFFEFPPEEDSSEDCWQSLCGLKMKTLLCQRRYISEEYDLHIDVRIFSSTLLACVLNSLCLCLALIESWILRCRTTFLLSMYMKVAREQPCWASTVKVAWMLPGSLCKRHSLHYGTVFTEI